MTNRFVIPLLLAATVAFARGSSVRDDSADDKTHHATVKGTTITSAFDVKVADANDVTFQLSVTNFTAKMLEIRFPNGLTHDFYVVDANGKEVWRWSKGRMFTQGIQNKLLKSRSTTIFDEKWNPEGLEGEFTAVAVLRSNNHPVESRVTFRLP
jgi:hypothetical protein